MNKMMSLVISFFILHDEYAQVSPCTPAWPDTSHGIIPDTTQNFPVAYANVPYDIVVQFRVPTSELVYSLPIPIDHIVLTNVTGLSAIPASTPFSYACNPSGCSFHSDSIGCVRITGTPTTTGIYPLFINADVYTSPDFFIPFDYPGYRIVVYGNVGINGVSNSVFDVSQNSPNPCSKTTQINVNLVHGETITLKVSNLIGEEIFSQSFDGKPGQNLLDIHVEDFLPGIYFFTAGIPKESITRKMVVER